MPGRTTLFINWEQKTKVKSGLSRDSINPFDTSHRTKIGAKSAKLRVDILMPNHYHVIASLETVQPPMFACYTLGLPSNLSSVPQLPPGGC